MTRINLFIFASAYAILATSTVLANDIYKYTDENGTVHYVDRPTGAPTEERVTAIVTNRSAQPRPANDGPDWRERRAARKSAQEEARTAKADEEERAKLCQEYRQRLNQYNDARRLYRTDEQGERVYLSEEEIEETRRVVQERIEENCSA